MNLLINSEFFWSSQLSRHDLPNKNDRSIHVIITNSLEKKKKNGERNKSVRTHGTSIRNSTNFQVRYIGCECVRRRMCVIFVFRTYDVRIYLFTTFCAIRRRHFHRSNYFSENSILLRTVYSTKIIMREFVGNPTRKTRLFTNWCIHFKIIIIVI